MKRIVSYALVFFFLAACFFACVHHWDDDLPEDGTPEEGTFSVREAQHYFEQHAQALNPLSLFAPAGSTRSGDMPATV